MPSPYRVFCLEALLYFLGTTAALWFLTAAPLPIPLFGTHSTRFTYLILSVAMSKCALDLIGKCYPFELDLCRKRLTRYRLLLGLTPMILAILLEYTGAFVSDTIVSIESGRWVRHLLRCLLSIAIVTLWTFFYPTKAEQDKQLSDPPTPQSLFVWAIILGGVMTNLGALQQLQDQLDEYRSIDENAYPARALRHLQCVYEIDDRAVVGGLTAKERIFELMNRVVSIRNKLDPSQIHDSKLTKEQLILKLALDDTQLSQDWMRHQTPDDEDYLLLVGLILQHAKAWGSLLEWTAQSQSKPDLNTSNTSDRLAYWRCLSLAKLGKIDQAIESYESAIGAQDQPADHLIIELAVLYSERGQVHKALALLSGAKRTSPSDHWDSLIRRLRTNSCLILP